MGAGIGTRSRPRWAILLIVAGIGCAALGSGCVQRRFVVQTNVPGAQVFINNQPIGASPADATWEYPGYYDFLAVAEGYQPTRERVYIKPKWYEYPGIDFIFEVLYPFNIQDIRRVPLTLQPMNQVRTDELLEAANNLRAESTQLPPPKYPDPAPGRRGPNNILPD